MNCMKCGVEIPENHAFCDHCLAAMEDYPVKPGAPIHLPKREDPVIAPKRSAKKKRTLNADAQLSVLRTNVLRLRLTVVILAFLLLLSSALLGLKTYEEYTSKPETGKNYTIDTSSKPQSTTGIIVDSAK